MRLAIRSLCEGMMSGPPLSEIIHHLVRRQAVSHLTRMNRQTRPPSAFSKVSVKSQTVIPREVREQLGLKPGDTLRYRLTHDGVLLDKAPVSEADDPFAAFTEWSGEADEKAFDSL